MSEAKLTPAGIPTISEVSEALRVLLEHGKVISSNKEFGNVFSHVQLFAALTAQLSAISNALVSIDKRLEEQNARYGSSNTGGR